MIMLSKGPDKLSENYKLKGDELSGSDRIVSKDVPWGDETHSITTHTVTLRLRLICHISP